MDDEKLFQWGPVIEQVFISTPEEREDLITLLNATFCSCGRERPCNCERDE